MPVADILTKVRASGNVTAEDTLGARRVVYGDDGTVDAREFEGLFAIDEAATTADPEWRALLVEAGCDFIVRQQKPFGYIDLANADWLIARIGKDGLVKTGSELELLVKVLEAAQNSPEQLVAYALHQVECAVVDGAGPLASGHHLTPGHIGRAETDLIRRILYAFAGDAGIGITRSEAEVLFNINDRTTEADNDPAWTDLFVKALANCIMAASGYVAPSREVALKREEWLDAPSGGIGNFMSRMVSGGFSGILAAYKTPSGESAAAARNHAKSQEIAAAEIVNKDEAEWLAHHIGRDGNLHDNEKALLSFLKAEAPTIHPALMPLIDKAG
jgi:hypothetical protein